MAVATQSINAAETAGATEYAPVESSPPTPQQTSPAVPTSGGPPLPDDSSATEQY
jgi:hypothetical protein